MKKSLKNIAAVMTAAVLMLQPMAAYAAFYSPVELDNAYAEIYIQDITAGAFARTCEDADFKITGSAWDVYWLPYSFFNTADQRIYCEAYVSTGCATDLMKKVEATIYVSTPDMDDENGTWIEAPVM